MRSPKNHTWEVDSVFRGEHFESDYGQETETFADSTVAAPKTNADGVWFCVTVISTSRPNDF